MRDDSALFELTISSGDLLITPYSTKYDFQTVNDKQTIRNH